jgi:hypothetical protein
MSCSGIELMTVGAVVENKAALGAKRIRGISRVRSAAHRARVKPTIILRGGDREISEHR